MTGNDTVKTNISKLLTLLLFFCITCSPLKAESQEEREYYDPILKSLEKALYQQHDWFSHESMRSEVDIPGNATPNHSKKCWKNGTSGNQAQDNLDEMCKLSAYDYWVNIAVPRMKQLINTRQNHSEINYTASMSYEHFSELGTSFRREIILPSDTINSESIDFRCIWAIDAFIPVGKNPFLDQGRSLDWFSRPESTGKDYFISECRRIVSDFTSYIEETAKTNFIQVADSRLINLEEVKSQNKRFTKIMKERWQPVVEYIDKDKGNSLSEELINASALYSFRDKQYYEETRPYCSYNTASLVNCPMIVQYTNFAINNLAPAIEKISLNGLELGISPTEFYRRLGCSDMEDNLQVGQIPFFEAFETLNIKDDISNLHALGRSMMACRYNDMTMAGLGVYMPVGFFNSDNELEFFAFTLTGELSSSEGRPFSKFTEALKKKYPNSVVDGFGFAHSIGDIEARMRDKEGAHLIVRENSMPIVAVVSEELVMRQPIVVKQILEYQSKQFEDYRDDL